MQDMWHFSFTSLIMAVCMIYRNDLTRKENCVYLYRLVEARLWPRRYTPEMETEWHIHEISSIDHSHNHGMSRWRM
jgi:hypothetical protein